MSINVYLIGNVIRVLGIFTDPNSTPPGALMNPTTVTIEAADPTGAVQVGFPITHPSVGVYYADFPITIDGVWWYDVISTGVGQARAEASFRALPSHIKP